MTTYGDERIDLEIDTFDGGETIRVVHAERIAPFFFKSDRSSEGADSYDARSMDRRQRERFEEADLEVLNRTMETRTSKRYWEDVLEKDPSPRWLRDLDLSWDLMRMSDDDWSSRGCGRSIEKAFGHLYGAHRRKGVITKLLHLKRPDLIPICDSVVAGVMRLRQDDPAALTRFVVHLREQGRRNLDELLSVQRTLADLGLERTLPRILEAVLWCRAASSGPYWYFMHLIESAP